MSPPAPAGKKSAAKAPRRKAAPRGRRDHSPLPDPRPPVQILAEEVLLTKAMLARILGYRSVRSVDLLVADDCVSDSPCLKPIYLRRPPQHETRRRLQPLLQERALRGVLPLRLRGEDAARLPRGSGVEGRRGAVRGGKKIKGGFYPFPWTTTGRFSRFPHSFQEPR